MYKQLWEREILKHPPGILSSLSLGSSKSRGSVVHADSADSGPLHDDDEDNSLAENNGKTPGNSVVICDDRGNEPVVGLEDVPPGACREKDESVSVCESDSGEGAEKSSWGEEGEEVKEDVPASILADIHYGEGYPGSWQRFGAVIRSRNKLYDMKKGMEVEDNLVDAICE